MGKHCDMGLLNCIGSITSSLRIYLEIDDSKNLSLIELEDDYYSYSCDDENLLYRLFSKIDKVMLPRLY